MKLAKTTTTTKLKKLAMLRIFLDVKCKLNIADNFFKY